MLATRRRAPAPAQDYPTRPIRMITPFTPGSPVDVVARLLAQHLSVKLGQSVVVENRPGAGTTIGMKAATLAEPDGYTLLFQSSSLVVAPAMYKNLDYDPIKSFAPVANVAWGSWVTVVPPSLPVHSPQELIAYAKRQPGQAQLRLRPGHRAAARRRVVQQDQRAADRQRALQGRHAGDHRHAGRHDPPQHRHDSTLLPLIREGKMRAIAQWGQAAASPTCPTCRP